VGSERGMAAVHGMQVVSCRVGSSDSTCGTLAHATVICCVHGWQLTVGFFRHITGMLTAVMMSFDLSRVLSGLTPSDDASQQLYKGPCAG
jgi:hypothetical protein